MGGIVGVTPEYAWAVGTLTWGFTTAILYPFKSSDIGVYYFNQSEQGSNVEEIPINNKGQFSKPFPKGFYDVAYNLSSKLMDVMLEEKND